MAARRNTERQREHDGARAWVECGKVTDFRGRVWCVWVCVWCVGIVWVLRGRGRVRVAGAWVIRERWWVGVIGAWV